MTSLSQDVRDVIDAIKEPGALFMLGNFMRTTSGKQLREAAMAQESRRWAAEENARELRALVIREDQRGTIEILTNEVESLRERIAELEAKVLPADVLATVRDALKDDTAMHVIRAEADRALEFLDEHYPEVSP